MCCSLSSTPCENCVLIPETLLCQPKTHLSDLVLKILALPAPTTGKVFNQVDLALKILALFAPTTGKVFNQVDLALKISALPAPTIGKVFN